MGRSEAAPAAVHRARDELVRGTVLPAHPLALDARRRLDERRLRALTRYYVDAGAGGVAVGVHTTQFEIRDPRHGLLEPVLELVAEELDRRDTERVSPLVRVAGICGDTTRAVAEANLARSLGYHFGLLSLSALCGRRESALVAHARSVADILPLVGFYLNPEVGGIPLSHAFWRRFVEIERVVAIKIAPFNRYRTIDVVRAVAEAGRDDIALYTGNDDSIVLDLLTPYRFRVGGRGVERRIVGGLLGHWAVGTRRAVELLERVHELARTGAGVPRDLLALANQVTDANAAYFDAANGFAGCVPGIHEVLRRQGLLEGVWCLDPALDLSPGQSEEIDRVHAAYPHLLDDAFIEARRDTWLGG